MKKKEKALLLILTFAALLFAARKTTAEGAVTYLENNKWVSGTTKGSDRVFNYAFIFPSNGNAKVELSLPNNYYHVNGVKTNNPTPEVVLYYKYPGWTNIGWVKYGKTGSLQTLRTDKGTRLDISVYEPAGFSKHRTAYRLRVVFTPANPTPTPKPTKTKLPTTGYYIIQSGSNSNMALDINNFAMEENGNLEIYSKNGGTNQIFYVKKGSDGYYTIKALHSGKYIYKCLHNMRQSNVAQGSFSKIRKSHYQKITAAKWKITSAGNGYCKLENKTDAGGFLENKNGAVTNANNVITNPQKSWNAQKWKFVKVNAPNFAVSLNVSEAPSSSGVYMNTGYVRVNGTVSSNYPVTKMKLCVFKGDSASGSPVLTDSVTYNQKSFSFGRELNLTKLSPGSSIVRYSLWSYCYNAEGKVFLSKISSFLVERMDNEIDFSGIYTFYSTVASNKVMDVQGRWTNEGTNVIQWDDLDANNQKFKIEPCTGSWFYIIDVNSGKALQVSPDKKGNAHNVCVYTKNSSVKGQRWRFQNAGERIYCVQNYYGYYLDVTGGYPYNDTNIQVWAKNTTNAQMWRISKTNYESTLSISGQTEPGTIIKGNGFDLHGVVKSNYLIKKVTVGIYNQNDDAISTKTVNPNATSYNVNNLNYEIDVPNYTGTFRYKVIASDERKRDVVLQDSQFAIVENSLVSDAEIERARAAYGIQVNSNAYQALKMINTKYGKNLASNYSGMNIFLFEGAGMNNSISVRQNALCVVVKNRQIVYINLYSTTLPDNPFSPRNNWDRINNCPYPIPTLKSGIYNISGCNHFGYAALHVNNAAVVRFSDQNNYYSSTSDAINVHRKSYDQLSNPRDTWGNSTGCMNIGKAGTGPASDYSRFITATGIVNQGWSGNMPCLSAYLDKIVGKLVVDRSFARTYMSAIGYSGNAIALIG